MSPYYPPGAEFDPMAPWNQVEAGDPYECACCQCAVDLLRGDLCSTCQREADEHAPLD